MVEPRRVTFEITETGVISNLPAARTMMHRLRVAGFRFALDDFGAGFSSFSYLKDLIADFLKIDGSFIQDAEKDGANWIFVEMMNERSSACTQINSFSTDSNSSGAA